MEKKRLLNSVHKDKFRQNSFNNSRNSSDRKKGYKRITNSCSSNSFVMINVTDPQKIVRQSSSNLSHNQTNISSNFRNTPSRHNSIELKDHNEIFDTKLANIESKFRSIKDILVLRNNRFDTIKELNNETLNNSLDLSYVKKKRKIFIPLNGKYKLESFEKIRRNSQERMSVYNNLFIEVKNHISDINLLKDLAFPNNTGSSISMNTNENINLHNVYKDYAKSNVFTKLHNKPQSQKLINSSPNYDLDDPIKSSSSFLSLYKKNSSQTKDNSYSSIYGKKDILNNTKLIHSNDQSNKNSDKSKGKIYQNKKILKVKETSIIYKSFQQTRNERNKSVQDNNELFKTSYFRDSLSEIKGEEDTSICNLPQTTYKTNNLKEVTINTKKRRFYSQENFKLVLKCEEEEVKKEITTINEEDLESCYIPIQYESKFEENDISKLKHEKLEKDIVRRI